VAKSVDTTPSNGLSSDSIKFNSNVHIGNEITISVDVAGNSTAEFGSTIPGLLNWFN
jgi:hypothetical protein